MLRGRMRPKIAPSGKNTAHNDPEELSQHDLVNLGDAIETMCASLLWGACCTVRE